MLWPLACFSFILYRPYDYRFQTSGGDVTIDKAWNWTMNSTYKEQRMFNGQIVNVWTYEVGIVVTLIPPFIVHWRKKQGPPPPPFSREE